MADIAAADVTYTQQSSKLGADGRVSRVFKVEFGDGALTYPTGGVPLTKAKLACPNVIESLKIVGDSVSDGYLWKYDFPNNKLLAFYGEYTNVADGPLIEVPNSVTPAATDIYVEVCGW